jgi:ribA/ribD-fused uncharacterized protein
MNVDELVRAVSAGEMFEYVFFWGHTPKVPGTIDSACLSQWWPCSFAVDGVTYTSAEQFMMAEKARLMNDATTRAKILETNDPGEVKALGRIVQNYDGALWDRERFDVVVRGSTAKFASHAGLKEFLVGTGDAILVEASPKDAIWGIGLAAHEPAARDPRAWKGANLLGFALMRARSSLR